VLRWSHIAGGLSQDRAKKEFNGVEQEIEAYKRCIWSGKNPSSILKTLLALNAA